MQFTKNLITSFFILILALAFLFPIQLQQTNNKNYGVQKPKLIDLTSYESKPITLQFQASGNLPLGSRVFYFGDVNSIPTGFSRDTNFDDDKHLQGGAIDFNGSVSVTNIIHTHVQEFHDHNGSSSHTHSSSGLAASGGSFTFVTSSVRPTPPFPTVTTNHSHLSRTSPATTLDYTTDGDLNLNATASDRPPSVRAIILKPDNENQNICALCVVFTDETIVPTGFGTYSPTNDRFIAGATTDSGGGSNFGQETHKHTSNPTHTHPTPAHDHSIHILGAGTALNIFTNSPNTSVIPRAHHDGVLDSGSGGSSGTANPDSNVVNNDPVFTTLLGIRNTSGSATTPGNVVVAFVGDVNSIPDGWILMDGNGSSLVETINFQIKATTDVNKIGDSGGNNIHEHVMDSHSHDSIGSHNHSITTSGTGGTLTVDSGFLSQAPFNVVHTHNWAVTSTNPSASDSATIGVSVSESRRKYRTVIFIKKIVTDTCTAPEDGTDWIVNCDDNCFINASVDQKGGTLIFTNNGFFDLNAIIRRLGGIFWPADPDTCTLRIFIFDSGGIEYGS